MVRLLEEGHREEERREGEGKAKGLVMCTLYPGLDPPRQRGGRRAAGAPEFDGGKFWAQIRNNFLGKKANTKLDGEDMQRLRSLPWFRKLQRKWKLNAVPKGGRPRHSHLSAKATYRRRASCAHSAKAGFDDA